MNLPWTLSSTLYVLYVLFLRHCGNTNNIFCIHPKIDGDTAAPSWGPCWQVEARCQDHQLHPSCPSWAWALGCCHPDCAWTGGSLLHPSRSEQSFLEAVGLNHSNWQFPWALFHCSRVLGRLDSSPGYCFSEGLVPPFQSLEGSDPWILLAEVIGHLSLWGQRRKWQLTPQFLPRKFHEQRSLAGYSPWGHKESDMTEWLSPCLYWDLSYLPNSTHFCGGQWVGRELPG